MSDPALADDAAAGEARARARANWPVARFALGEEPPDDLCARTTAAERVAIVEELSTSTQAWALSGRPFPSYARHEMPGRIVRRPR